MLSAIRSPNPISINFQNHHEETDSRHTVLVRDPYLRGPADARAAAEPHPPLDDARQPGERGHRVGLPLRPADRPYRTELPER